MKAIPEHSAVHAARLQESQAQAGRAGSQPPRAAALPQLLGNRGFARWLSGLEPEGVRQAPPLQAKLGVGPVDDPLEHEADRVAEAITRGEEVQIGGVAGAGPQAPATDGLGPALAEPGMAMPPSVRAPLEQRMHRDFSDVRLHTGPSSREAAGLLQARAFTVGRDIVFGAGEYAPQTQAGGRLLAHELTHVVQQSGGASAVGGARIQRKQKGKQETKPAKPAALKPDSEKTHGDYYFASYTIDGITLRLAIGNAARPDVEKNLAAIAAAIQAANKAIPDANSQVKLCAIANATTRFTTFKGAPILVLAPEFADAATARHELGHATFDYLRAQKGTKGPQAGTALQIADIFLELEATQAVKAKQREFDVDAGKVVDKDAELPAGLWIADPPQWSGPGARSEHPWQDADEFFASARAAFLTNRKGFEKSINKFSKLDSKVRKPANRLIALLEALSSGKAPKAAGAPSKEAEKHLAGISFPTPTEDTLDSALNQSLSWALKPDTWP